MKEYKNILICFGLLLTAFGVYVGLVKTAPSAKPKAMERQSLIVESINTEIKNQNVFLELAGVVKPDQEVILKSRVSGEIKYISDEFIEGGLINKGELILQIDPSDYQILLTNAQAKLENAKFNYELELGRQDIAQREWELLKTPNPTKAQESLALRKPHLSASYAALKSAEAQLRKANIDLERTSIYAPYNIIVKNADVDIGSQATPQSSLGVLVGTDRFLIEASIPLDRLKWINIPGGNARIISNTGAEYNGKIIKLMSSLETNGRMGRILIAVDNPWSKNINFNKPLILNEYVKISIKGNALEAVTKIPRKALRENNAVWIDEGGALKIVPVEVLFYEKESVLIRGIESDSLLIISNISAPIPNMPVNSIKD